MTWGHCLAYPSLSFLSFLWSQQEYPPHTVGPGVSWLSGTAPSSMPLAHTECSVHTGYHLSCSVVIADWRLLRWSSYHPGILRGPVLPSPAPTLCPGALLAPASASSRWHLLPLPRIIQGGARSAVAARPWVWGGPGAGGRPGGPPPLAPSHAFLVITSSFYFRAIIWPHSPTAPPTARRGWRRGKAMALQGGVLA